MGAERVERVLVVPRSKLFAGGPVPQGYHEGDLAGLRRRIEEHGRFVDRPAAEEDPSMKQIIPYCFLSWDGKVFLLRRLATQTESRLHHKLSVGVGGHINPEDPGPGSVLERGALRELHEEVEIRSLYRLALKGYLNDESNPVGQVHFGLVYEVSLEGGEVSVAEKDLMQGEFVPTSNLRGHRERMETWSQILADHLLATGASPSDSP